MNKINRLLKIEWSKILGCFSLKNTSLLIILCTLSTSVYTQEFKLKNSKEKMNFIIIFADDLGYGDLGVYGHPSISTPNLDKMAAEGQKWTNFYVGASVCTPSRAALMTGRLPIRSGMASNQNRVLFPDSHHGLPQSEVTIAEQMKKAGYATSCIGKWHLGHKEEYLPTNNGFDSYFGIPYSNDMDAVVDYAAVGGYMGLWKSDIRKDIKTFNVPLMRDIEVVERPADQHTITRRYTEESIKFINEHKENPFFLYLAYNLPHVPLFASEKFEGKSIRGIYGDVVEEIDFSVGQILSKLKETGLDKNTLVVFTSDNGPWLIMNEEGGSAGLLREGKGSTWEGGMREPCIFWSPKHIKPAVIQDLGSTMDLFTTFSHLAGQEIPKDRVIDGVDLSPVLFDHKKGDRNDMFYYRGTDLFAVRVGSYKAHFITRSGYGGNKIIHETPILYNLDIDPSEKYDIAAENPEIIELILESVENHRRKMVMGPDQLKDRG
jgi:arylsulfatase A